MITCFIAGDSTAASGTDGKIGWGKYLPNYFDSNKLSVKNHARAGRSSKTFILEGHWAALLSEVREADYVIIQFGQNDGGELFTEKARGSLPGTGNETKKGKIADGTVQTAHTFGFYIHTMITDVRAKGAIPIVLSLTCRNLWENDAISDGNTVYGEWEKEVATKDEVVFIDLFALICDRYNEMGKEAVSRFFPQDHVHTNEEGADFNASLIASALRNIKGSPFAPCSR
jgi:rhamnogalacturonan acetylesterase